MPIDFKFFFSVALAVIGAVVWLVRLEGRINVQDERYREIERRLSHIDGKLDRLLNGRRPL